MTPETSAPTPKRSTGRRVGPTETRGDILDAARDLFAAHGYEGASLRAIAARAGVDTGLIRHFFGNKQSLFAATVADRTVIPERMAAALLGPRETVGARVADAYFALWEDDETRSILMGLIRSALTSDQGVGMLLEVIGGRIQETAPFPPGKDGRMRGLALTSAHLVGVAVARHLLQVPMLVDMTREELVAAVGPSLQRYLTSPDL